MTEWLDLSQTWLGQQVLWGVTPWQLGLALVIVFLGFLSRRLILSLFDGILKRVARRSEVDWDDDAVELLPAPLALVIHILLWYAAAAVLALPQEPVDIRLFVFQGLEVALAVAVTWVVFRLLDVVSRVLERLSERTDTRLDDQIVPLLRKTLKVFLAVTVAVMVVQNLGYSVTSFIASLGIGGLALALAAKDTVANFFGSVVVFTDRPFHVGDWIAFGEVEGVVEEVGFRTTRIRRLDHALVTVPNMTFTSTPIINRSARPNWRIKLVVGLTYETSADQMERFLASVRALLKRQPGIDQTFHFAHFVGFGGSSLDVEVYCFAATRVWPDWLAIQEDLMLAIMRLIDAQGLEVAFPTRTVYFRDEQWPQAAGNGQVREEGRGRRSEGKPSS